MGLFSSFKNEIVPKERSLQGRPNAMPVPERHVVLGTPIVPPFPETTETAIFALGCFWGAERLFYRTEGVYTTAVGYSGGYTPNPTYEEVCSGRTGHTEAVLVVFDPSVVSYERLAAIFFEGHDPTQRMRQGNDIGTQYRSAIYTTSESQAESVRSALENYQGQLTATGFGEIATEVAPAGPFFYAEEYHQQYLAKNPGGYCGLGGTGVSCPVGLSAS